MKRFFFPILMSAMLVYGGKASAQTDKDHKSVKPLPAGHKPAVAPVTVKPLPPAPTAAKPVPVQRPAAAPAPITAKPIPVAPRPLPSSAKPVPVASKPAPVVKPVPVVTKPVPVTQKTVVKTPAHVAPAATKSKSKKAVAGKAGKKKAAKNVEIVTNEPVYTPAPAYREPERLNVEQRHEGPTVVEIKDQKIKVNDETVARLNSVNDCIRITVDHKSEINLVPEKKEECVKERHCCHGKMTRYCYMMEHKCKKPSECKHECRPAGERPMRPCRYNY